MAELAKVNPTHIQWVETSNKGVSFTCLYQIADALQAAIADK